MLVRAVDRNRVQQLRRATQRRPPLERPRGRAKDLWASWVDALNATWHLKAAVAKIPNVVSDPAAEVKLLDMNLVGPAIAVRPYCHTDHCWQVYFDTNGSIVRMAKEAGCAAPTPTQIMKTVAL